DQAEKHAAEVTVVLLSSWKAGPPWSRGTSLPDGARGLAPYLPATAASPLVDVLDEALGKATDALDSTRLAGALLAALARLPAEQASARADKAAASAVKALLVSVEKPAGAAPRWPSRRSRFGPAQEPGPLAQLAGQLKALLQRLPPEK